MSRGFYHIVLNGCELRLYLRCEVNFFLHAISFENEETTTFKKKLERSDDNRTITCTASNNDKPISSSIKLNVLCKSMFPCECYLDLDVHIDVLFVGKTGKIKNLK